ncbi:hypothetical protein JCM10908_001592 [Rhodotorula pacifica]|uniref:Swc4p n=1 Tax=Rhodotorula pacifica TaxID=1495444 RepID=UPI00317C5F40
MTSRDVRDIMQLGPAPSASSSSLLQPAPSVRRGGGPPGPPTKRLDGITRELYALIGDNQPALALAQPVKPKFKERAKAVRRSAHWSRVAFSHPARGAANDAAGQAETDAEAQARRKLVLRHWVKDLSSTLVDGAPDHKFAKFNTSSQPYSYTDAEYDAWLKVDDWTKPETDHLFSLARQYDLRFIVMADRWEGPRERSVDDLKNRYYAVCRALAANRPTPEATDPAEKEKLDKARQDAVASFSFDINRETERKAYLRSLLSRTPAQIAEEDFLYVESRRIEQNYHKIASERAELLHLLGGREGLGIVGSGMQLGVGGGAKGISQSAKDAEKRKKGPGWEMVAGVNALPEGWAGEGSKRRITAAEDAALCIERHPIPTGLAPKASAAPASTTRSGRLAPVKAGLAAKVTAALAETGISTTLIMPTKGNMSKLDDLQAALSQMVELKKAIDRAQGEIRLHRKKRAQLLGEEEPVIKGEDEDDSKGHANRNKRSASVASSTVSTKRARH